MSLGAGIQAYPRWSAAIVLGGSLARGTATSGSDYDLGLYCEPESALDTNHVLEVTKGLVDDPTAAALTAVGEWGPWIVGGGWLSIEGEKVDLLYGNTADVEQIIRNCCVWQRFHGLSTGAPTWILLYAARYMVKESYSMNNGQMCCRDLVLNKPRGTT